ncbi:MAG TPA: glycosyltransferase [Acidimicrobiia bacterium]|nr:glycosyltransferase [Acidimicrobiia bacterium]
MRPLDLSVVVPVHDNAATLDDQLRALVGSDRPPREILVVDNRSTDGAGEVARRWARACPFLRVIDATDRASEGYARNVGVAASCAASVAFCDGDDVVGSSWVTAMATGLARSDFLTGPVDLDLLNPSWLADVRGRRIFEAPSLLFDQVPFAHGCNFGVRRSIFGQIGPFREDLPAGMDLEFSVRAWRAGIPLAWAPEAVVHYRLRPGSAQRWRQSVSYGRAQPRLRRLAPELASSRAVARQTARRLAWLVVRLPLLYRRDLRARWLWTLGLVTGELASHVPSRGGGRWTSR